MNLQERIRSFAVLGETLRNSLDEKSERTDDRLNVLIKSQQIHNPWFTPENVSRAFNSIANELTAENLIRWTNRYPRLDEETIPWNVGIIMAGNIPLVGFHDFLSVLITGNNLIAKTSSKDHELIVYINDLLCSINPLFAEKIEFTDGPLSNFDAVIATGSETAQDSLTTILANILI
jgi:hypothetical protein